MDTQAHTQAHMVTHRHTDTHTDTHRGIHKQAQTHSHTHRHKNAHTHRHTVLSASSYETVCVCPISRLVLQPPLCRVSSPEAREPCPGTVSALCRVAGGLQKSITPKDRRVAPWTPEWPKARSTLQATSLHHPQL